MWAFSVISGIIAAALLQGTVIAPTQIVFDSDFDFSNGSQIWAHPSSSDRYIDVRAFGLCHGQTLYSGYYHDLCSDVHLFFVYARASENPETSPLALWSNGGPGTSGVSLAFSSATGCILEKTSNGMKLSYKPDAKRWNEKVNVIFIEQPIGTGCSYGSGASGEDTRIGAEDIYHFIQVVLSRHPHIPNVSFHSLSYGGHFVPEWANKVIEENARIERYGAVSNERVIPLNRVTMGNAWFGNDEQYLSLFDTLCEDEPYIGGPSDPLLPRSECTRVSASRAVCANLLEQCRNHSQEICGAAHMWCWAAVRYHFKRSGRAMYDLSAVSAEIDAYDTYPELTQYLNLRTVQVALGVIGPDEPMPRKWEYFNQSVSALHLLAGDHARPTDGLLPKLVEAGIDILLYIGTLDLSCNFRAARALVASRHLVEEDIPEDFKNWKQGIGRYICSGKKKSGAGTFCYLEIDGAGHGLAYEFEGWGDIFEKWVVQGSL